MAGIYSDCSTREINLMNALSAGQGWDGVVGDWGGGRLPSNKPTNYEFTSIVLIYRYYSSPKAAAHIVVPRSALY